MKRIKGDDPTPRQFVKDMLPPTYDVTETTTGIIRCISSEGMEGAEDWANFMNALKKYFGDAFKEVHHWTCTNHVDFTVYYSYNELYNLEYNKKSGRSLTKNKPQQNKYNGSR